MTDENSREDLFDDEEFEKPPSDVRTDELVIVTQAECARMEVIASKISQYTGLAIKQKKLDSKMVRNITLAIETDAGVFFSKNNNTGDPLMRGHYYQEKPMKMAGMPPQFRVGNDVPLSGILHLHLEDCFIDSDAILLLHDWFERKNYIETLQLNNIQFQNQDRDFRKLIDSLCSNSCLRKLTLNNLIFDLDSHGKYLCKLLEKNNGLRELSIDRCKFVHPKFFYELVQPLIQDRSRLSVLRLIGMKISQLEARLIQFVALKNRVIHTLDLSHAVITDGHQTISMLVDKFNDGCQIRHLTLDGMSPNFGKAGNDLGLTIGCNSKLDVLSLRDLDFVSKEFKEFCNGMKDNSNLKKLVLSKCEMTEYKADSLCQFLKVKDIALIDLDLSNNAMSDKSLIMLCEAFSYNHTIKYLNLANNLIKNAAMTPLADYLSDDKCKLEELSLSGNKIDGNGIAKFSKFVANNKSLIMLDISKNPYNDTNFDIFAKEIAKNQTLQLLDISRIKDISDEGSLQTLAESLTVNDSIKTLDFTGLKVKKPFLKEKLLPCLKKNIKLKYVVGKFPQDVIKDELTTNQVIENQIIPRYREAQEDHEKYNFDVSLTDSQSQTGLYMANCQPKLYEPAIKLLVYRDLRVIDLTNLDLNDSTITPIVDHLGRKTNLRSLILDNNDMTDYGIWRLSASLRINDKLNHLSIRGNGPVTDVGIQHLCDMLVDYNSTLYKIEYDENIVDRNLRQRMRLETTLNQQIQLELKPKMIDYANTDQCLRLVGSHTINVLHLSKMHIPSHKVIHELVFDEDAQIALRFEAVLKSYKLMRPNVIQLEQKGLNDLHAHQLIEFLKGRHMICYLNLRRNVLTNKSALEISDWLQYHDGMLYKLNLERNRITEPGAQAILKTLKLNIRLLDVSIYYGNRFSSKTEFDIQIEMRANQQVIQQRDSTHDKISKGQMDPIFSLHFSLSDYGPTFIPASIKGVRLLNILHLALPDNSLMLDQANLLADMIKQNPALRSLNLSQNKLDFECAEVLGDALQYNDQLMKLDLSCNQLGDLGAFHLLRPMIKIRQEMQATLENFKEFQSFQKRPTFKKGVKPIIEEQDDEENPALTRTLTIHKEDLASFKEQKKQHNNFRKELTKWNTMRNQTDQCLISSLLSLNLQDNRMTFESYRSIVTMLATNEQISIQFDTPDEICDRVIEEIRGDYVHDMELKREKKNASNASKPVMKTEDGKLIDLGQEDKDKDQNQDKSDKKEAKLDIEFASVDSKTNSRNPPTPKKLDPKAQAEADKKKKDQEKIQERLRLMAEQKEKDVKAAQLASYKRFYACFGYKGYQPWISDPDEYPTRNVVCCWRYYQARNEAYKYDPEFDHRNAMESKSGANTLTVFLIFEFVLFYFSLMTPFMFDWKTTLYIYMGYFVQVLLFELIVTCALKPKGSNIGACNIFLFWKTIVGVLRKAMLLLCAKILSYAIEGHDALGYIEIFVGVLVILIQVVLQLREVYMAFKIDPSKNLKTITKRNELISDAFSMLAIKVYLRKVTIDPTLDAERLADKIEIDNNPDRLHEKHAKSEKCEKYWKATKKMFGRNITLSHLLLVDIPTGVLVALALEHDINKHFEVTVGMAVVFCFDVLASIITICDLEKGASQSIDTDLVYDVATRRNANIQFNDDYERLNEMKERYAELLKGKNDSGSKEKQKADVLQTEVELSMIDKDGRNETKDNLLGNTTIIDDDSVMPFEDLGAGLQESQIFDRSLETRNRQQTQSQDKPAMTLDVDHARNVKQQFAATGQAGGSQQVFPYIEDMKENA